MAQPQKSGLSRKDAWTVGISVGIFVLITIFIVNLPKTTPPWVFFVLIGGALGLCVIGVLISRKKR